MPLEITKVDSPYVQYPFVYKDSLGRTFAPEMIYDVRTDTVAASPDMVAMNSVATHIFGKQSQYASRWIDGAWGEYPNLGEGLRYGGNSGEYHVMTFHHADIPELFARVQAWQTAFAGRAFDDETRIWREATEDEVRQGRMYFGGLAISTVLS